MIWIFNFFLVEPEAIMQFFLYICHFIYWTFRISFNFFFSSILLYFRSVNILQKNSFLLKKRIFKMDS